MIDYLKSYLNGAFDADFKERENLAERLSKRIARIEKQSKKIESQAKENLRRWF